MSSEPTRSDVDRPRSRPLRTLAFQINVWYVIAFVASLTLLASFAVPIVRNALDRERTLVLERRLERHVALLNAGLPAYRAAVDGSTPLEETPEAVRIRDEQNRTVYQRGDVTRARLVVSREIGRLRLEIGAPTMQWDAVLDRLFPGAIALGCGALLVAVIGGYAVTRRSLRPVRDLAAVAREVIRSGDLNRRVPERGTRDELDTLSTLFNRMLERNHELVVHMREALDNVAHDLRTPLTRVRGIAEVALRSSDPADAREALADCIEESEHVLVMLRAIMDISEADTGIMRLERTPVSLRKLSHEVADVYAHVADEAGVKLVVEPGEEEIIVDADPVRLRQAIANLVDNALKYTPPGGEVAVEIGRFEHGEGLRVRDTGEGIPAEAIPRIWDRLYRADPSRSKRGLGLGLSLVRAIIEAHGGRVTVQSELGKGSTFTVTF